MAAGVGRHARPQRGTASVRGRPAHPGAGLPGRAGARARGGAVPGPDAGHRRAAGHGSPERDRGPEPDRQDPVRGQRGHQGGPVRRDHPGRRARHAAARLPAHRGRDPAAHRRGRRRRGDGRRRREPVPAGRGLGHDLQGRRGRGRFHTGGEPGPVDSVYLGVYRREAIEKAGGYDEEYLRAEDWELNHRIRLTGGVIWFEPELRVTYRPRSNPRMLGAQYFHYGRWRRVVARQHVGTINLRYLAPPAAGSVIAAGTVVGVAGLAGIAAGAPDGVRWLTLGLAVPATYLA